MTLVAIYCTMLLFNISGTPTAILRLSGRYHAAAYCPIGNALLRVGLCYPGRRNGEGVGLFVSLTFAAQPLRLLTYLAYGRRSTHHHTKISETACKENKSKT